MEEFKKLLSDLQINKYRNSLSIISLNQKLYNRERNNFYKMFKNIHSKKKLIDDKIYLKIKNYYKNEKFNDIYIYYKKFNIFLNLKSEYKYHKAISKKKANLKTILYLCSVVIEIDLLNIYQKLNYILKVNDYLIINFNENNIDYETKKIALTLFYKEKELIRKLEN